MLKPKTDHPERSRHESPRGELRWRQLVNESDAAMLTTADSRGRLCTRPITMLEGDAPDELYFFVIAAQAPELGDGRPVSIGQRASGRGSLLTIRGVAEVVFDRERMRSLWRPSFFAAFPLGLDDPDLALVRVRIDDVGCWDAPTAELMDHVHFERVGDTHAEVRPLIETKAHNDDRELVSGYGQGWNREQTGRLLMSLEQLRTRHSPGVS